MSSRVRRHLRTHVEPPWGRGKGGGASKHSVATTYDVSQTWATGSARPHIHKHNACLCGGQSRQNVCLYTQHIQMEQYVPAMDLAFGARSKVVHKITQYRNCNMHCPH